MRSSHAAVTRIMKKLDDETGVVWSYDEVFKYLEDAYAQFCRETKCLFDMHVIENRPQTGNWSTDLERYLAEQTPGMGLTDERLHFTAEHERDQYIGGEVGGSTEGPTPATSPSETSYFDDFNITSKVASGRIPEETVAVVRVTWDELELQPEGSAEMRQRDTQYEKRDGGDPQQWTFDKDGLLSIRLIPPARANASYPTVDGSWGTMTQTSATVTVHGSWGILREVVGAFPAGGPHGTPTQQHPAVNNTVVEILRNGRSLKSHGFEIPLSLVKYVEFGAMHRALKRAGEGQDLKLSKHYADRFQLGVERAKSQLRKVNKERVLKMGNVIHEQSFGLGDPQLPYPYGPKGRDIR